MFHTVYVNLRGTEIVSGSDLVKALKVGFLQSSAWGNVWNPVANLLSRTFDLNGFLEVIAAKIPNFAGWDRPYILVIDHADILRTLAEYDSQVKK